MRLEFRDLVVRVLPAREAVADQRFAGCNNSHDCGKTSDCDDNTYGCNCSEKGRTKHHDDGSGSSILDPRALQRALAERLAARSS